MGRRASRRLSARLSGAERRRHAGYLRSPHLCRCITTFCGTPRRTAPGFARSSRSAPASRSTRAPARQVVYQPLSNFALLTQAQDLTPLVSAGGGVKIQLAPHVQLRAELHDYLTPFPKQVITPHKEPKSAAGCRISCRWSASATRPRKVAKPPEIERASRRDRVARDLPKAGSFSFIEW